MASPIVYEHEPSTPVWVIKTNGSGCPSAVVAGIVIQVRITAQITETIIEYDIRLDGDNGTTEIIEDDIFVSLEAAVNEYEIRLT